MEKYLKNIIMDKLGILRAIEALNETLQIFSAIDYVEGITAISKKITELARQL